MIAIDAVNAVRDYVERKALVEAGLVAAPEELADVGIPLKTLM